MNNKEFDDIFEKSLRSEPDIQLPDDFARKVTTFVIRRTQWKADLWEYFYISTFLVFVIGIIAGTYFFVNKDQLIEIFSIIKNNSLMVGFGLFILNFILLADRVLLPMLFNRWKLNR